MAEWSCIKCTYLNPDSNATTCELCGSGRDGFNEDKKWTCSACTSSQPSSATHCMVCGTVCDKPEAAAAAECVLGKPPGQAAGTFTSAPAPMLTGTDAYDEDLYILDACSCRMRRNDLQQHLTSAITDHVLPSTSALHTAVASLSCPRCSSLLSNQDVYRILGGTGLGQVYISLCAKVALIMPETSDAKPSSPPTCPDCSTTMTPTSALKTPNCPNKQTLKQALKCRGLQQPPGPKDQSATALAAALSATATWCCLTCPAVVDPPAAARAAVAAAVADSTAGSSSSSNSQPPAAVAAVKATCSSSLSAYSAVQELQGVMKGDPQAVAGDVAGKGKKGGGGGRGGRGGGRRWSYGGGGSSKWAAGTGKMHCTKWHW